MESWSLFLLLLSPPRRLCFHPCLLACLFICRQDYKQNTEQIFVKLCRRKEHGPRKKALHLKVRAMCTILFLFYLNYNQILKHNYFVMSSYKSLCENTFLSIFHLLMKCFVRHRLNRPANAIVLCISIIHSIFSLRGRKFL